MSVNFVNNRTITPSRYTKYKFNIYSQIGKMEKMKSIIHILYTSFSRQLSRKEWVAATKNFPDQIIQEINKYKKWQDRHARLFGKLLLVKGLGHYYPKPYQLLSKIKFNKYRRPYINSKIDFNISHSGDYVVVAISKDTRVGIDLEKIREIDISAFQKYLGEHEWHKLQNTQDQITLFFEYWTKKESIIKADGRGLFASIKNIRLQDNIGTLDQKQWHLKQINLDPHYKCYLSSEKIADSVNMLL